MRLVARAAPGCVRATWAFMGLGCALALACAGPAAAAPLDAVVGTVNSTTVSASDIALARALSLFGFTPSEEPIRATDVDRYGTALVSALEASRLGIGPTLTELDEAWTELEARMGGSDQLRAWLESTTIDTAWARRALEAHLRWRTWTALNEGLTIQTPGAAPETPAALESELVTRTLLRPDEAIPVPFAMPARARP